jgi:hypothetical protein
VFAANNPFLGDADSLAKGRELFRRGVLTGERRALQGCRRAGKGRLGRGRAFVLARVRATQGTLRVPPQPPHAHAPTPTTSTPPSEAVLALEAECQRNPGNAEAWRLLGTVQAENDDDQQAIAAMNRWG